MPLLVYGFARSADLRRSDAMRSIIGCCAEPLSTRTHEHLSAIVGEVDDAPPASMATLRAFQTSVTSLHDALPLVPARFAPPTQDDELKRFLMARDAHLHAVLDLIEGCQEWSIRVKIQHAPGPSQPDQARPDQALPTEPLMLAPASATDAPGTSGAAYLRRRKQAFDHADGIPPELLDLCKGPLKPAIDLARATRLEGPTPSIAMHAVHLLIPRDEQAELERVFALIVQSTRGRVLMTGPWPAYSFTTPIP